MTPALPLYSYLAKLQARPAYRRALDRGGPYELIRTLQ